MPHFNELPGRNIVEQAHALVVNTPQVITEAIHTSTGSSLLEVLGGLINWAAANPEVAAIPLLFLAALSTTLMHESRRGPLE